MLRIQTNGDDIKEGHLGGCAIGGDAGTYYPLMWTMLIDALKAKSVIDVGCGLGYALDYFKDLGVEIRGVEGSSQAVQQSLVPSQCVLHDYSQAPYEPEKDFDLGWCCEFVEHVDQKFEANFFATFKRCRFLAMTFAAPGQGGYHHVNEQPEEYWIARIESLGFVFDRGMTELLRSIAKLDASRHQAIPNAPYFISHFITRGLFFRKANELVAYDCKIESSSQSRAPAPASHSVAEIESRIRTSREFPKEDFPKPCGRDAFYRAVAQAVTTPGLWLEFGVYEGGTINFLASLRPDVTLWGFDSFEGLPEQWNGVVPKGHFNLGGNLPPVASNVRLVKGWFDQTLPGFLREHSEQIAFLHIDSDLYSSARTVLTHCAPRLRSGSIIVFDELLNYPGYEQHELKAFQEFLTETGFGFEPIGWVNEDFSRAAVRLVSR